MKTIFVDIIFKFEIKELNRRSMCPRGMQVQRSRGTRTSTIGFRVQVIHNECIALVSQPHSHDNADSHSGDFKLDVCHLSVEVAL